MAVLMTGVMGIASSAAAAPPGAPIDNTASVRFDNAAGAEVRVASNVVELVTAVTRSPSAIALTRVTPEGGLLESVGPSFCAAGAQYLPMPNPVVPGAGSVDPLATHTLDVAVSYNLGEPVFLRLTDSDQNVDYQVVDTATVVVTNPTNGDAVTVRLSETGPNTGVFAGYVPTARGTPDQDDCVLHASMGHSLHVSYTDPSDAGDASFATATLDPLARVFDSQTGRPATVFGRDGSSRFPAEVVAGRTLTDASGASYAFGDGEFRFPSVPAGEYRLEVEPPEGYAGPSTAAEHALQGLPNAPFLIGPASYEQSFSYDGNGPFAFDYPVDPRSSALFLSKTTASATAAPGDFVRYQISVENTSATDVAEDTVIVDRLPPGTRYVRGSATADGQPMAEPSVAATAMELRFAVGELAPSTRVAVAYVLEIVGGQRGDDLVNAAEARAAGGLLSNSAEARLRLREDLFRTSSTLLGRVVAGSCDDETFAEDQGVTDVRVYLEDGRYAVTDEGGRFHFEGLTPGRHVAQLDLDSLPSYFEIVGCERQGRFAGRVDSQIVDVSPGALQRANFYLRRKTAAEGSVDVSLQSAHGDDADSVRYRVFVQGSGTVAVDDLKTVVMLPEGMHYRDGSLSIDGVRGTEPRLEGRSMTIALGDRMGTWDLAIAFDADIDSHVSGDLRTRAIARFDSPVEDNQQTPVAETWLAREAGTWEDTGYVLRFEFGVLSAELAAADRNALDALIEDWRGLKEIRVTAVGHSDSVPIRVSNRATFTDNYALSRARAEAVANYLAHGLGIADDDLQVTGRGPDDPVASNDTEEGRRQNRRVELVLGGQRPGKQSHLLVERASSGTRAAATRGLVPGAPEAAQQLLDSQALADHLAPPQEREPHINSLRPGAGWVSPQEDFQPAIPAVRIAVKHAREQKVALFVNGLEVRALNFDGTATNTERTVALSRWSGVDLLEGTNTLVADIVDDNGRVVDRLTRKIHYAGPPVRAEFLAEASRLVADGKTRPVIALRMLDRYGAPARHSTVGAFSVDSPYRSWWAVQNGRENQLVHIGNREPTFTVGDEGIAYLELEPTTQSGAATVRIKFANQHEQEFNVWLEPQPRDWILVGFGEGTIGYDTLSKNRIAAARAGAADGYYDDGRVAFFAKGQIKGEYLLTLAYDSARDAEQARQRFQTEVDPNEYYTLYGDNTEQRFEAPSQRKLYVKLERKQFLALFGDYATGLSTTELTRYERRFNGLKSEFFGQNVGYSAFAAETDQAFVRDEIPGDGTSGLYRLRQAPLIANSEMVRLEVRDRFDPAVVLSTQSLTRFLDYQLDPLNGTLFFKRPVPSRDGEFNPVFIVAEYETAGTGADDVVSGARLAVYDDEKSLELGVTHVNEDRQAERGALSGVDLRWRVTDVTEVRAEYAASEASQVSPNGRATAQLLSVEHRGEQLDLRATYREVDQDFGLGQQNTAERGIRKYALEGRYALTGELRLTAQAALQENLETGAERTLAGADVEYKGDKTSAMLGLTHADDRYLEGDRRTSNIVDAGVSRRLFDSALTARANGSVGIGGTPENADYLSSYVVGFDFAVLPEADVYVEYENAEGQGIDAEMSRLGVRATPWQRAQVNSALTHEMSEFGPRLFANLGLIQGFQLNDRWAFDVGLDQTRTLRGGDEPVFDPDRPPAFGSLSEDFIAGYVGTLYQSELWSVNTRLEYRNADTERRTSLLSGWYREPRRGQGVSAGLTLYQSDRGDGTRAAAAELRFGWAYRNPESRWALLHRADLEYEDLSAAGADAQTWRLINNLNANRRLGAASELALQYAFKVVRSNFAVDAVTGYTDLIGVDFSRGFGGRWEAGVHTSVYHSYRADVYDYGVGLDIGLNVADDMWLSVGYNFAGFHDDDFAQARYTAQGPYLTLTVRTHQEALKRLTGR